jgi:aminopeptidase N
MKRVLLILIATLCIYCGRQPDKPLELSEGVSKDLAVHRKAQVSGVKYHLSFNIPEKKEDSISSRLVLELKINDPDKPLVLDFKSDKENPPSGTVNGVTVPIQYQKEHLIIPAAQLKKGPNKIEIEFTAGEMSLNRNEDYLFTLLVPDRARTLFPCFDQPDIKAAYVLDITAPADWAVLCGAPLEQLERKGEITEHRFRESDRMSTYLFSFVAGKFDIERSVDSRRKMNLFHQEKDSTKIRLSTGVIFDLHQRSLDYMEQYTNYDFPFQKFDYATIFGHPYGGMEHTGAIQYRQSVLFQDNSATENQKLRRAKLIAHETAHMWFGNLVTMEWFSDVWMKEVFANFMADKLVNPEFPEINHDLSFFIDHYPAAYSIDRSRGANPIRQDLDNLNNAGSLYGSIIYHKAPLMMRRLEALVGEDNFRKGIREYIRIYADGNADWNDLVEILDKNTELDLKQWSEVWVNSPSRPVISARVLYDDQNHIRSFDLEQNAEDGSENVWPQVFEIALVYPDSLHILKAGLKARKLHLGEAKGLAKPDLILYNSNGHGYGVFPVSDAELESASEIGNELTRSSLYVNCHENVLNGDVPVEQAFDIYLKGLKAEKNELILSRLADQANHLYWTYFTEKERLQRQNEVAELLFSRLQGVEEPSIKKTLFRSFQSFAHAGDARDRLHRIWNGELPIANLVLNQDDLTQIAMQLALYEHPSAPEILEVAKTALTDPNKIERFEFLMPSLSQEPKTRNDHFRSFAKKENREKENWVLSACYYLHHPLRQKTAIESLPISLDLIEEIQQTGDIFFPKGWLDSTIGMYSSDQAYTILNEFLEANPNLNPQLRMKVLQATDDLYRIQNHGAEK